MSEQDSAGDASVTPEMAEEERWKETEEDYDQRCYHKTGASDWLRNGQVKSRCQPLDGIAGEAVC